MSKTNITIPNGLERLLVDLTVKILACQPVDLYEFSFNYFKNAYEKEKSCAKSCVTSDDDTLSNLNYEVISRQENSYESDEEDDTLDESELSKVIKYQPIGLSPNIRRTSVFNKSFDPESPKVQSEFFSEKSEDFETKKNFYYEHRSCEKSEEQRDRLKHVLRSIVLFKHLESSDIEKIIDSMFERKCSPNEFIIQEGDNGNYFYVVLKGHFEIYKRDSAFDANSEQDDTLKLSGTKLGELINRGYFGELALLYNQPRSATIISKDYGILFCMNREKFQTLVIHSNYLRRKKYEEFLRSVSFLNECMDDYERSQIAECLSSRTYSPGQCIFRQNDTANGMYFIESGKVRIFTENNEEGVEKRRTELSKLPTGAYFGEMGLINKAPRSASAYVDDESDCKLAFLDTDAFERLMGSCIELFKSKIKDYK